MRQSGFAIMPCAGRPAPEMLFTNQVHIYRESSVRIHYFSFCRSGSDIALRLRIDSRARPARERGSTSRMTGVPQVSAGR